MSSTLNIFRAAALVCILLGHSFGYAEETLAPVRVIITGADSPVGNFQIEAASASHIKDLKISDVPASVTSVTAEQLQERADYSIGDAVLRTPGLSSVSSPGNGGLSFSSRGFSGANSIGVADDGVMLDVVAGTISYPSLSWGYERVDVLRGPGSLMYGTGTMGATINAIRKKPSRTRSSEFLLSAGQHGTLRGGAGLSGPLGETMSYRLDTYVDRTSGERMLGHESNAKIMSGLRWRPQSELTFDFTADISNRRPERYFGIPVGPDNRPPKWMRRMNYNAADSNIHFRDQRFTAGVEWRPTNEIAVKNTLYQFETDRGWRDIEAYEYNLRSNTVDRFDYIAVGHHVKQTGNQLGLQLKAGAHSLAAGWNYSNSSLLWELNSPYGGHSIVSATDPVSGHWNSPDPFIPTFTARMKHNAVYIEDAWTPQTGWIILAGLRRDWYHVHNTDFRNGARVDQTLASTSGRLGVTKILPSGLRMYGQFTIGSDPLTGLLSLTSSRSQYKLTTGRQVEFGLKHEAPSGKGGWTFAVYQINKRDIITRDPQRPLISIQGGRQSSRGIEFSADYRPTRSLRLEGNVAYTRARFDELREGSLGVDRAGNRPADIPSVTANLWGHYRSGPWQAGLGLRYVGARFVDNANSATLPSYAVVDAVVGWEPSPRIGLNIIARNLTNRYYGASSSSGQWLIGGSRRFEIGLNMRF